MGKTRPINKKEQEATRERNLAKLPDQAYVAVLGEEVVCIVKKGENGYYRTDWRRHKGDHDRQIIELNRRLKVTEAQASAMLHGSMFGWHTKAADVDSLVNQPAKGRPNL